MSFRASFQVLFKYTETKGVETSLILSAHLLPPVALFPRFGGITNKPQIPEHPTAPAMAPWVFLMGHGAGNSFTEGKNPFGMEGGAGRADGREGNRLCLMHDGGKRDILAVPRAKGVEGMELPGPLCAECAVPGVRMCRQWQSPGSAAPRCSGSLRWPTASIASHRSAKTQPLREILKEK